jgi:hypothetical protein
MEVGPEDKRFPKRGSWRTASYVHCALLRKILFMTPSTRLPADAMAERIVRHFQTVGFPGITEALLVRIQLRKGDRLEVDAAFDLALEREMAPPLQEFFEIRPCGFYSEIRDFADAKTAFTGDFGRGLRIELPSIFFDAAPVIVDDALATGTKYDAMLKLSDNTEGAAVAILLNDPNSSFFEYLDAQSGYDWQKITGSLDAAAKSFSADEDLL